MSLPFNNEPAFSNPEWDRILTAAQRNNAQLIEHLITNLNVSPDHANGVGQSSLHVAALWGNLEACEMLLKYNANTNAQNQINGATPLHSAVQSMKQPISMRTRCVQKILEQEGCNPQTTDSNGFTPLTCLEKILEKESNRFNSNDLQDLNDMREVLVAAMSQSEAQRNPLFQMIDNYDVDAVKKGLQTDEQLTRTINDQDSKTAYSPLSYVCEKVVSQVEELIDNPPDEKSFSQVEKLKDIALLLLECGAVVQTTVFVIPGKADKEKDPFHEICTTLSDVISNAENDDFEQIISTLKEIAFGLHSAGVDMSSKTMSCLHNASRRGKLEIVQFWIEKLGVDVNVKGRQGLTALHFAARSGQVDIAKYLLQNESIDVCVLDDRGKTAMEAAVVNGKEDIAQLIQQQL